MTDLERTRGRIRALPAQHAILTGLLGVIAHHGGPGRRVAPGSRVLLNLRADELLTDIAYTLDLAGEIVADQLGQPDPTSLDAAGELVAANLETLAQLGPWPMLFWSRAGTWRAILEPAGVDVIARLEGLTLRANAALGITRARTHRDVACARCRAKTVGRWAGSDWWDCSTCGTRFHETDIRRQDRILVELWRRGKLDGARR